MAAASTITILLVNIHVALLVLINRHSSSAHYQPLSPAADDDVEEAGEECPQDQANFFQLLTFSWMNPLMRLGRDRPLTADDLWNCRPEDKSRRISVQFQQAWQRELNGANPSLFYALLAVFGREYSFSGLLKFCQDCVQFIQPKLLAMLIAFVANYSSGSSDIVTGIAIVLAMPMAACVQSLLLHQFFHRCMVVGMHVRSAVVTAIYRKSLALSNDSRQRYTTGEIVNLMSVDAQRFMELASFLHVLWSSPLQIGCKFM
jgi:hypothetical protein